MDISQHIFKALYMNLRCAEVRNISGSKSISVEFRWNGQIRPYYIIEIDSAWIYLYRMVPIEAGVGYVTRQREKEPIGTWQYA